MEAGDVVAYTAVGVVILGSIFLILLGFFRGRGH